MTNGNRLSQNDGARRLENMPLCWGPVMETIQPFVSTEPPRVQLAEIEELNTRIVSGRKRALNHFDYKWNRRNEILVGRWTINLTRRESECGQRSAAVFFVLQQGYNREQLFQTRASKTCENRP